MASFATATATILFDLNADSTEEKREARVAIQEIPGGDTFYVDRAGRRPQYVTVEVVVANATAWGALMSALSQPGTLTAELMDTHAAVLMSLTRPAPMLDGRTKARAEFLLTDT